MPPKNPWGTQGSAGQGQFGTLVRNTWGGPGHGGASQDISGTFNPDDPNASNIYGNFADQATGHESTDPSSQYRGLASAYRYQDAPNIDWSNRDAAGALEDQSRGEQMNSINVAENAARGGAPSAARIQGAGGIQSALSSAFAHGGGGASAAGAAPGQAVGFGGAVGDVVGQAAGGRAGEIGQAQSLFAGQGAAMHGQDLERRSQDAQAALGEAGMKNRAYLGYGNLGLGYERMAEQGREGSMRRLQRQREFNMASAERKKEMAAEDLKTGIATGIGTGTALMSGAAMMSDIRGKEDIAPAQPAVAQNYSAQNRDVEGSGKSIADAFLKSLSDSSSVYRYKDPANEPRTQPTGGHYLGVMAQNVEKVPEVGKQIVSERSDGMKTIEQKPMLSALAAAIGRLNQKVDEGQRSQPRTAGTEDLHRRALAQADEGNALVSDERAKEQAYQKGVREGSTRTTQQFQQERSAATKPFNMDTAVSRAIYGSGTAAAQSGQPQIAAQQFAEMGMHTKSPYAMALAGHMHAKAGDTQAAEKAYRAALAMNPDEQVAQVARNATAKDGLTPSIDQQNERKKKKMARDAEGVSYKGDTEE